MNFHLNRAILIQIEFVKNETADDLTSIAAETIK